eukprot:TRINITY_DN2838_c0_g1_i1.p1 TRINITY_DN2838_c0_g1~~TRINITY_DN2838_c0_g1_i1.p1  ORF type:complete len:1370 (-),score=220.90 TRINITY_DN2838_c0_g1_i1:1179-5288(-)
MTNLETEALLPLSALKFAFPHHVVVRCDKHDKDRLQLQAKSTERVAGERTVPLFRSYDVEDDDEEEEDDDDDDDSDDADNRTSGWTCGVPAVKKPTCAYTIVSSGEGARRLGLVDDACLESVCEVVVVEREAPVVVFTLVICNSDPNDSRVDSSVLEGPVVNVPGTDGLLLVLLRPRHGGSVRMHSTQPIPPTPRQQQQHCRNLEDQTEEREVAMLKDRITVLAEDLERQIDVATSKSMFIAKISHELRTPLHTVIGMSCLLLDTRLEREQHEFVKGINSSSEILLHVINDILDYSKLEAGQADLAASSFCLPGVLEELVDVMGWEKETEIDVLTEVSHNIPPFAVGDSGRLRQVLMNLLSNSIKFSPRGSTVVLRCSVVPDVKAWLSLSKKEDESEDKVSGEDVTCVGDPVAAGDSGVSNDDDLSTNLGSDSSDGDLPDELVVLRFEVIDSGIGIPFDKIQAIFDTFVQADSSVARRFGGTGLGLPIVKSLTELMNGRVSVVSDVGKGTTFTVELPFITDNKSTRKMCNDVVNFVHVVAATQACRDSQLGGTGPSHANDGMPPARRMSAMELDSRRGSTSGSTGVRLFTKWAGLGSAFRKHSIDASPSTTATTHVSLTIVTSRRRTLPGWEVSKTDGLDGKSEAVSPPPHEGVSPSGLTSFIETGVDDLTASALSGNLPAPQVSIFMPVGKSTIISVKIKVIEHRLRECLHQLGISWFRMVLVPMPTNNQNAWSQTMSDFFNSRIPVFLLSSTPAEQQLMMHASSTIRAIHPADFEIPIISLSSWKLPPMVVARGHGVDYQLPVERLGLLTPNSVLYAMNCSFMGLGKFRDQSSPSGKSDSSSSVHAMHFPGSPLRRRRSSSSTSSRTPSTSSLRGISPFSDASPETPTKTESPNTAVQGDVSPRPRAQSPRAQSPKSSMDTVVEASLSSEEPSVDADDTAALPPLPALDSIASESNDGVETNSALSQFLPSSSLEQSTSPSLSPSASPRRPSRLRRSTSSSSSSPRSTTLTSPRVTPAPAAKERGKVLIVDDNKLNRLLASKMLQRSGWPYWAEAANGLEAVQAYTNSAPGEFVCILMDINMPVMDGLEASRAIREIERENPERGRTAIVAMTAAMGEASHASANPAIDAWVYKPMRPNTLQQVLDRVVGEHLLEQQQPESVLACMVKLVDKIKEDSQVALTSWSVTSHLSDQKALLVQQRVGKHEFVTDEPTFLGGSNQGPNPLETVLAGLGGCICIGIAATFLMKEIKLDDLQVRLTGMCDLRTFLRLVTPDEVTAGFQELTMEICVTCDESDEYVKELLESVIETSPVYSILAQPTLVVPKFRMHRGNSDDKGEFIPLHVPTGLRFPNVEQSRIGSCTSKIECT